MKKCVIGALAGVVSGMSAGADISLDAEMLTDNSAGLISLQWQGKRGFVYSVESSSDLTTWVPFSGPHYSFGQPHSLGVSTFTPPPPPGGGPPPEPPYDEYRSGHFIIDAYSDGSSLISWRLGEAALTVKDSLDFHTGTALQSFFFQNYDQTEDDPSNPGQQLDVRYSVSLFLIRHDTSTPPVGGGIGTPSGLSPEDAAQFSILSGLYSQIIADLASNAQGNAAHQHAPTGNLGQRRFVRIVEEEIDTDGDTISDADEINAADPTSPALWDSDGDGVSDGDEKTAGTDPTDPEDAPGFDLPSLNAHYAGLSYYGIENPQGGNTGTWYQVGTVLDNTSTVVSQLDQGTLSISEINSLLPAFEENPASGGSLSNLSWLVGWDSSVYGLALLEKGESLPADDTAATMEALRLQAKITIQRDKESTWHFLQRTKNDDYTGNEPDYEYAFTSLTIPPRSNSSGPLDLRPELPLPGNGQQEFTLERLDILMPLEMHIDASRDGHISADDENFDSLGPFEEQAAYDETGNLRDHGALVICHYDEDEGLDKTFNGNSQPSTDIIYQANDGLLSNEDFTFGAAEWEEDPQDPTVEIVRDIHELHIAAMPHLPEDARVFLVVEEHAMIEAFHLYKKIDKGEEAVWGGYPYDTAAPAPWTSGPNAETNLGNNQREVTWLLNPNTTGPDSYVETRPSTNGAADNPDAPYIFGIEGVYYRGQKYKRAENDDLTEFNGIVELHLEIEMEVEGSPVRKRVDTVKWTQIRVPSFPGAEGAGKWALGGRYGEVYKVTTLADSGAGSLRAGIENRNTIPGTNRLRPRTIVFDVAGYIDLQSALVIEEGFLTIAGQTAPGDGICIRRWPLIIKNDHVAVRYLRSRIGDQIPPPHLTMELDALEIKSGSHIILDHCSLTWGTDVALEIRYEDSLRVDNRITVQRCIIGQTLRHSFHRQDNSNPTQSHRPCISHSFGAVLRGGRNARYSLLYNALASCEKRMPKIRNPIRSTDIPPDPVGLVVDLRGNVIYWEGTAAGQNRGKQNEEACFYNFIKNSYSQPSVGDITSAAMFEEFSQISKMHRSQNAPTSLGVSFPTGQPQNYFSGEFLILEAPETEDAILQIQSKVLERAGVAMTRDWQSDIATNIRDEADSAFVANIELKTSGVIDSPELPPTTVGGAVWVENISGDALNPQPQRVGGSGFPDLTSENRPQTFDSDSDGIEDAWEIARIVDVSPNDQLGALVDVLSYGDFNYDGYTNIEAYINEIAFDDSKNW